jgi:hypothetical protein
MKRLRPHDLDHPIWDAPTINKLIHQWELLDAQYQPVEENQSLQIMRCIQRDGLIKIHCGCKGKTGNLWDIRNGQMKIDFPGEAGVYNPVMKTVALESITKPELK